MNTTTLRKYALIVVLTIALMLTTACTSNAQGYTLTKTCDNCGAQTAYSIMQDLAGIEH